MVHPGQVTRISQGDIRHFHISTLDSVWRIRSRLFLHTCITLQEAMSARVRCVLMWGDCQFGLGEASSVCRVYRRHNVTQKVHSGSRCLFNEASQVT